MQSLPIIEPFNEGKDFSTRFIPRVVRPQAHFFLGRAAQFDYLTALMPRADKSPRHACHALKREEGKGEDYFFLR